MVNPKISRSADYYRIVADKHARSGLGVEQEKVHRHLAEWVMSCESLEEIQRRLKEEGLQEKPAQALLVDKMANHARAARENDLPELAEIYERRRTEIEGDYALAYTTGWEQEVTGRLSKLNSIMDLMNQLLQIWTEAIMTVPENPAYQDLCTKASGLVNEVHAKGYEIRDVLNRPYFRKHIGLDDAQYEHYVAFVLGSSSFSRPDDQYAGRIQEVLSFVKNNRSALANVGKEFNAKCRRKGVLMIAPDAEPGAYQVEVFYDQPA